MKSPPLGGFLLGVHISIIAQTQRLVLRAWREADRAPFAALNKDPAVMTYLGKPLTREQSDAAVERQIALMEKGEPAFWAVERKDTHAFIGCIGVKAVTFEAPFTPCHEIGWRLSSSNWGKGFATEGARAALQAGFNQWDMDEIYSFTVPENLKSQSVMKRIGMMRLMSGDFEHPNLAKDDPLSKHVLYHINKASLSI